jgi:hypothetical protein
MKVTLLSAGAIASNILVKFGADPSHVVACGAALSGDVPIGVTLTSATGANQPVTVALLSGALTLTAAAAITHGTQVENAASGTCQHLGGGVGLHQVIGVALTDAAGIGDPVTISAGYFIREI